MLAGPTLSGMFDNQRDPRVTRPPLHQRDIGHSRYTNIDRLNKLIQNPRLSYVEHLLSSFFSGHRLPRRKRCAVGMILSETDIYAGGVTSLVTIESAISNHTQGNQTLFAHPFTPCHLSASTRRPASLNEETEGTRVA